MSVLNDEGLAAILGLVIKTTGEVTVSQESIEEGLPANAAVRVEVNEEGGVTVKIVEVAE